MSELNRPQGEMAAPASAPPLGSEPAEIKAERYRWLKSAPRALTLSEGNLFLILAVIIGLFSGMAVVFFRLTIEWIRLALFGSALALSSLRVFLVPAGVRVLVGFLMQRFFRAPRA